MGVADGEEAVISDRTADVAEAEAMHRDEADGSIWSAAM
jgi:hypothetical protein